MRRKFVEAEPHYPEAGEMVDGIGELYAVEAEAKRASPEERLATLAALRSEQSKPVLGEIRTWLMTQRALPRSALGKAIAYTSGLWRGLVRFLADAKIPLDTNSVERALRGVAVGRKNHYGSRSLLSAPVRPRQRKLLVFLVLFASSQAEGRGFETRLVLQVSRAPRWTHTAGLCCSVGRLRHRGLALAGSREARDAVGSEAADAVTLPAPDGCLQETSHEPNGPASRGATLRQHGLR